MPPPGASATRKRTPPGPALPTTWTDRFLAYYQEHGGLWRAAHAADVSVRTVQRYRETHPDFDQAVRDAREYHADLTEERLVASAERSDNPVGYIVRLKALRPDQYIEKHAVLSLNVTAELGGQDAGALLAQMIAHMSPATHALLHHGVTQEPGSAALALPETPTALPAGSQ